MLTTTSTALLPVLPAIRSPDVNGRVPSAQTLYTQEAGGPRLQFPAASTTVVYSTLFRVMVTGHPRCRTGDKPAQDLRL